MVSPLIYVTVICCSKIQLSHCDNNLMQNGIKHTQTHAHTLIYKNDWDLFKKSSQVIRAHEYITLFNPLNSRFDYFKLHVWTCFYRDIMELF